MRRQRAVAQARVIVVFLAVHADHRLPGGDAPFGRGVVVGELGVPVGVAPALDRLGVASRVQKVWRIGPGRGDARSLARWSTSSGLLLGVAT
jgi:hypothetical protein